MMGARRVQVLGVKPLVSKHSPQKWMRAWHTSWYLKPLGSTSATAWRIWVRERSWRARMPAISKMVCSSSDLPKVVFSILWIPLLTSRQCIEKRPAGRRAVRVVRTSADG